MKGEKERGGFSLNEGFLRYRVGLSSLERGYCLGFQSSERGLAKI